MNPEVLFNLAKLAIFCIGMAITAYCVGGMIKDQNRIATFKGSIVDDGRFFRHYECPKCSKRINIQKDNACKNCGTELF